MCQGEKGIHIETLVPRLSIEGLDKSVLLGLTRLNKADLDLLVTPSLEGS